MPKRPRPSRTKREARYAKHQNMRSDKKRRKRDNHAAFKGNLTRTNALKPTKDHSSRPKDGDATPAETDSKADANADAGAAPVDFRVILRQRDALRRARADRWRAGRHNRGKIQLFGYRLCPFAEQCRTALVMSRYAFTFTEPSLPYWLVPDEDEMEHNGKEDTSNANANVADKSSHSSPSDLTTVDAATTTTSGSTSNTSVDATINGSTTLQGQVEAFHLEALKLQHGDIILVSSWEIFLYIDCLLQAGSKVLKNRHTGVHRGARPFFPAEPKERQQCLKLLRLLHTNLVCAYWDLVESLKDKEAYTQTVAPALEKINQAASDVDSVVTESRTPFAFGLRRPGMLEAWCGPLFNRLRTLGLWKPTESLATWLDLCTDVSGAGAALVANDEEDQLAFMADLREFHTLGAGKKRPEWTNITAESVWH